MTLPEDGRGHFVAEPQINGARVQTLVDTGASIVALSFEDAARAGVYPAAHAFRLPVSPAHGSVNAAPVTLRYAPLPATGGEIELSEDDLDTEPWDGQAIDLRQDPAVDREPLALQLAETGRDP